MDPEIISKVHELAEPIVNELGLELVDIEFLRETQGWVLRIILDKEGGVNLNDCTKVGKELGYILEIKDVIAANYHLEVSSPGLNRSLKTLEDFEKFLGRKVSIKISEPLKGRKNFKGTLKAVQDGYIQLDIGGECWEIALQMVDKAKLIYKFSQNG
ncbi:MAG: ribosome maturation factor RimP [Proteobacteria bacterium]|nr:ribosome maturation factor RimP [Pseudomonadota bacterium]